MGFNFGAFAGGAAEGIQAGSDMFARQQDALLRQNLLKDALAQSAGRQAFSNTLIPGGQPVPAGLQGGSSQPLLSRIPVIGDIGEAIGLWGPTPSAAAPAGPQSGMAGPMPPGPSAPPPSPTGQLQQGPTAGGLPGVNPMAVQIATAVDRANPGLRQSNPAAFAAAVQMGIEHVQQTQKYGLETDIARANIDQTKAQTDATRAQTADIQGPGAKLKAAQTSNLEAEAKYREGEAKLAPAKLKVEEAKVKLEELKADQAQAEMRLKEAEVNAKVGDFKSQREYRDAQIAKMRADRMMEIGKQKLNEAKTGAEVENLKAQAGGHKAKINYYDMKAKGGGTDAQKAINNELTKAQVQLRFHEGQKNDLMTSINPTNPAIQARIREHDSYIQAYRARVNDLESQLSTAPKKEEAPAPQEIKPERQTELGKVSSKILELSKTQDTAGVQRLIQMLKSRGVPPHEIQWALNNARQMSNQAPSAPAPLPAARGPMVPGQ